MPEGLSASDIKKYHVGKFQRLIWTHDGRFFHNGQHKSYMWGPTKSGSTEEDVTKFVEMDRTWFRNKDEKIADWVTGKHCHAIILESGGLICSGYQFWRNIANDIKHNDENYEDWPITVKSPEGYDKAVAVFPAYKRRCVYVNWKNADGKTDSFRVGENDCFGGSTSEWW